MVEPITLQTLLTYLTLISIPVGVAYHIMTLRNTRKNQELTLETRQTQLFMQLVDRWGDPDFARVYTDFRYNICAKANNDPEEIRKIATQALFESYDPEVIIPLHTLTQYFEGISILVQKKLIDIDTVESLLSGRIIWYWDSLEPFVKYFRERVGDPTVYRDLEILANDMKKRKETSATDING
jgi:hypothetical protein